MKRFFRWMFRIKKVEANKSVIRMYELGTLFTTIKHDDFQYLKQVEREQNHFHYLS